MRQYWAVFVDELTTYQLDFDTLNSAINYLNFLFLTRQSSADYQAGIYDMVNEQLVSVREITGNLIPTWTSTHCPAPFPN